MSIEPRESVADRPQRPVYVFDEEALLHVYGQAGRTAFATTFDPDQVDVAVHQLTVMRLAMHTHDEWHTQRGADHTQTARRVRAANVLCGVLARQVEYPLPGLVFRRVPVSADDIARVARERFHHLGRHHVRWNHQSTPPCAEPDEMEHLIRVGVESLAQRRSVVVVTLHPDRVQWCHAAGLAVDQRFFAARALQVDRLRPAEATP